MGGTVQMISIKTGTAINIDSFIPMENYANVEDSATVLILKSIETEGISIPDHTPDWYFILFITVMVGLTWIKVVHTKYLYNFISSTVNYKLSHKVFNDVSIVRKRVGFALDFIYLINVSLFLFTLSGYYEYSPFHLSGIELFIFYTGVILALVLFRIFTANMVGLFFNRKDFFSGYIQHYYLYSKVLGLLLIPFILLIPYTEGIIQQISVNVGISMVVIVLFARIIRIILFIYDNGVLFFYLFLYLCTLEILPLLAMIRLITSLEQSS